MTQEGVVPIRADSLSVRNRDKLITLMLTTQSREVSRRVRDRYKMLAERKMDAFRKINPHRPFYEVMEDGAWAGQRCFIIGGGPSLRGFDFQRLEGRGRVIAINRAFIDVMFADILFFMDGSRNTFYGLVKANRIARDSLAKWQEFQGYKVYLNLVGRRLDDVHSVRSLGRTGVSNSIRKGLFHGNNSGSGALGLAIALRANPIYLLGIDGKFEGGRSHYHDGYATRRNPESTFESFAVEFNRVGKLIARTGFKVVNLNQRSAVKCFPFSTIDEVLGNGQTG